MRQIKFRAWDKKNKIMILWEDFCELFGGMEGNNLLTWFNNLNYEPQQFTGFLDKNGKEIYEGDIVKVRGFEPEEYEVVYDRGGFCLKFGNDSHFYPDIKYAEGESSEIIGNIYENPELLHE